MRNTWKGVNTDRFNMTKRTSVNSPNPQHNISNGFLNSSQVKFSAEDDDVVYFKLTRYEDKMRSHDERLASEQQRIIDNCRQHSQKVDETKALYEDMRKQTYEASFMRTVNKQLKTKTQVEKRDKNVAETVVEQLQEKHRQKLQKLRNQQEEERRQFKERYHKMHQTIRETEEKITLQRAAGSELMSGKVERKRLLVDSQAENDRRLKMMRHNFHSVLMSKHQYKDVKIGQVKRIMINHKGEPIHTLYGTLHNE